MTQPSAPLNAEQIDVWNTRIKHMMHTDAWENIDALCALAKSAVAEGAVVAIDTRIAAITKWIDEHAPAINEQQEHLNEGSCCRAYWHYGYLMALKDTRPVPAAPQAAGERATIIHERDCPKAWEFFTRHALGSKVCPSCLSCGQQSLIMGDGAIRHLELPDIYICEKCVAILHPVPAAPQASETAACPAVKGDGAINDKVYCVLPKGHTGHHDSGDKVLIRKLWGNAASPASGNQEGK